MKNLFHSLATCVHVVLLTAVSRFIENLYSLKKGMPEIKSTSALVFGPDGILFIGDSEPAPVFPVEAFIESRSK